jgi:putative permease
VILTRDQQLKKMLNIRLLFFLSVLLIAFCLIIFINNLMISLVLAFVTNYTLGPWVTALERTGLPRTIATILVFFIAGFLIVSAVYAALPVFADQLGRLHTELPNYVDGLTHLVNTAEERLQDLTGTYLRLDLGERIRTLFVGWTDGFIAILPNWVSRLMTVSLLAPILSFFMIKDGRSITRNVMAVVPNHIFELCLNLYHQINDQLGQFVRARLIEAAIVGLCTWLGLMIIHFPYAFLFGAVAGFLNLIPYLGPVLAALPAMALATVNNLSPLSLFGVVLVYGVAQLIDVVFIIPLVVAKVVNLHPLTVILSILVGAQTMGILGMLISIPLASVIKVTVGTVYRYTVEH